MNIRDMHRSLEFQNLMERQEFIRRLRAARKAKGLTQENAAHAIGVTTKSYSMWESPNGTTPHMSKYSKIAEVLDVDYEYLHGDPETDTPAAAKNRAREAQLDRIEKQLTDNNRLLQALFDELMPSSVAEVLEAEADRLDETRTPPAASSSRKPAKARAR